MCGLRPLSRSGLSVSLGKAGGRVLTPDLCGAGGSGRGVEELLGVLSVWKTGERAGGGIRPF